jgi:pSer/pThr/pTyr-binding forkhead associated (FHA) protein
VPVPAQPFPSDRGSEGDAVPPDNAAHLLVRSGPGAGSRFALTRARTAIGRSAKNDVVLDDVTVSRRHAVIDRVGSAHHLRDVGSLNGTYVDLHRIEYAELRHGDEVRIGRFTLVFRAAAAVSSSR